ncbi:MAG: ATP-binding cassette domain-containing protein [Desulfobacterales bacterium]|nr:ATP-binding cassette domain-containing protein [Desulfobacterales bacterium]MDJ0913701.1 ATP-binding cassette domain-containing protein [Desulfobacterales bacterium]
MTTQSIIKVKNLIGGYGEEVILNNINFDVKESEILVILGGSGCGKSTLLRHMVGLNRPMGGNIYVDGVDIASCHDAEFKKTLKKIGILFQGAALFGSMTVAENIALPILEYTDLPKKSIKNLIRMKLSLVELDGYENHLPFELSGGMKKRAGLARALAINPKILFLDEPSAGLDPITSAEIDQLILHINKVLGTTVVIVTHELASIFAVAQRVVMLDKKKKGIIAEGDPKFLKQHSENETVKAFFNRTSKSAIQPDRN